MAPLSLLSYHHTYAGPSDSQENARPTNYQNRDLPLSRHIAKSLLFFLCATFFQAALSQRIDYGYSGQFGKLGIADSAKAYNGNLLVAEARAIQIIQKSPGPNYLEVAESHYDSSGSTVYQGTITFQFGFSGGRIISETASSGKKRFQIFTGWPSR